MGNGWDHMMGWGGGMFGGIGMIFFWGVVIVLVVLLVRGFAGGWPSASQPRQPGSTALDILKERYAKGEISKEEYEERKKTLTE
jgi:putative membrane protein